MARGASINVVFLCEVRARCRSLNPACVFPALCFRVGHAPLEQLSLGGGGVGGVPFPRLQATLLQRAAEGKRETPRLYRVELIYGVERQRGLLLCHASRQERDPGHAAGDHMLQHPHRRQRDLGGVGLQARSTGLPRPHHVGFEDGAFQHYMVVRQMLEYAGEHFFRRCRRLLDAVTSVHEHLRLDDGYQPVGLADGRVPCQVGRVLFHGQWARAATPLAALLPAAAARVAAVRADLKHCPPLGEAHPGPVCRGAALVQVVQALGHRLAFRAVQRLDAQVDLQPNQDPVRFEEVGQRDAVAGASVKRFFVQNDAAHALLELGAAEEHLTVRDAVLQRVGDPDGLEPPSKRARGLVRSQDPLARGCNQARVGQQLSCKGRHGVSL
mmetsp:Transcript_6980/g.14328  ORF Transcript_6980/g.14328 Transcript_6980/m.14328 type:complete len:384 (-) Transcript_6980:75-1226(-)